MKLEVVCILGTKWPNSKTSAHFIEEGRRGTALVLAVEGTVAVPGRGASGPGVRARLTVFTAQHEGEGILSAPLAFLKMQSGLASSQHVSCPEAPGAMQMLSLLGATV